MQTLRVVFHLSVHLPRGRAVPEVRHAMAVDDAQRTLGAGRPLVRPLDMARDAGGAMNRWLVFAVAFYLGYAARGIVFLLWLRKTKGES
jgi:hypothetical protein